MSKASPHRCRRAKGHASRADDADHLVGVSAGRRQQATFQSAPGDKRSESEGPAPDGLVAGLSSALSANLLDIAKAQLEENGANKRAERRRAGSSGA